MPEDDTEPEERLLDKLLESGAEITGSVGGTAIGLLAGGPAGAVIGAGAGPAIVGVLKEFAHRTLSRRERARVGATVQLAAQRLQQRLDAGERLRDDAFFQHDKGRSTADELIEGILLTAQREYEERKVPYLANMLAGLMFEQGLDDGIARHVLRLAESLTYQQLCLLAILNWKQRWDLPGPSARRKEMINWRAFAVERDLAQLGFSKLEVVLPRSGAAAGLSGIPELTMSPRQLDVAGEGVLLVHLMELGRIPAADQKAVVDRLWEGYDRPEA